MPEWNDELRQKVIDMYIAENPTPETSAEIVASIVEDLGEDFTVNGVRAILSKAGKYVKKDQSNNGSTSEKKSTRVNKAEAISGLKTILESNSVEVDETIIDKMTGKAALYFTQVIEKLLED